MLKKHSKILNLAQERWEKAVNAEHDNRERMADDLRFANLDQWPEEVKQERANKPMLTLDHTGQHVRQVIGDIRQNRPAIKVRPHDDSSDKDTAEVIEGLIRHIESNSKAQIAYTTAAQSSVQMGYGVFRIVTEYATDDTFEQDIKIKRVRNPFTVYFDPGANELCREDMDWAFVSTMISQDEFKKKYPKAPVSDLGQLEKGDHRAKWYEPKKVRIAEYFVREDIEKEVSLMSDGQTLCLDDYTEEQRIEIAYQGLTVVKSRKVKTKKVLQYKITGDTILEGPNEFPSRYIPLIPVYGEESDIEGEVEYRGIVRAAKDPQRMYNYWRTTGVELLALQPKAPWLVTPTQIEGFDGYWDKAGTANMPYLPYNPDPQAPVPQRQMPPSPPSAVWQEAANSVDDIKAATGLYNSSLGQASNETSGRAIIARERQSDTSTFTYIDNLSRAIEHCGTILVDMIPKIYDTARTVRILGEDDAEKIVKVNQLGGKDITKGKYDVKVVTGPSYATKRMEAADSMMRFVQAVPQAGQVAADLIADNMDWPGAEKIASRLKKLVPPDMDEISEDDPDAQQKMQQAQQAQQQQMEMFALERDAKQAEIDKDKAKAALDSANAVKVSQEVESTDQKLEQMVGIMVQRALMGVVNG